MKIFSVVSVIILQLMQLIAFSSLLLAIEPIWVTVEGKAPVIDNRIEEARYLALEEAAFKAIKEAVGAHLSLESLIINLRLSGTLLRAIPYGRIVDKKILEEGLEKNIRGERQGERKDLPSSFYRVKMRAGVVEDTNGLDPNFRLTVSLNNYSFWDGNEIVISITPTRDCYLAVYNILEDEKIIRLLPNQIKTEVFVRGGEEFHFPDEDDKGKGIQLKVHLPEGREYITESFFITAFTEPYKLSQGKFQEGILGIYTGQTASIDDLIKEMAGIPLSKRAEKMVSYKIKKKTKGRSIKLR